MTFCLLEWPNSGFQGIIQFLSSTSPSQNSTCGLKTSIIASITFFFLFLTLSMIALVFFSKQLFNLFFFQFCSLFFWLLFFLFEIIHEIIFLLISSSFNFFHLSYLVPIIFIAIFFLYFVLTLIYFPFQFNPFFFLILIPNLVLIRLIAIFFLDLFYFLILSLDVLFHLFFISDLVLSLLVVIWFSFLFLDDWEICFVIFLDLPYMG